MEWVQEVFVNISKSLYEVVEASVLLGGECSRWFGVETGLCFHQFSIMYI